MFFQAEDGIRDLVRSRGLGDVYKRQHVFIAPQMYLENRYKDEWDFEMENDYEMPEEIKPVSYTHLTLPTSDLV